MTVRHHRDGAPFIIGHEDINQGNMLPQIGLCGSPISWESSFSHSPLPSPYLFRSPAIAGSLGRSSSSARHSVSPFESRSPSFTPQGASEGSTLSPFSPPFPSFGISTSPWTRYEVNSYSPRNNDQQRGVSFPHDQQDRPQHYTRSSARPVARYSHEISSGHHNVVDVERIRKGVDVRTTVSR